MCGTPPPAALAAIRAAQQANGGWNFNGDPTGTDVDPDTTAVAVEALVAGGADASDPAVHAALAFFAANQQASGAWQSFGTDDPNSTSLAILAITAAGFDVESSCWRDTADPAYGGQRVREPDRVAAFPAAHRAAGRRRSHREPERQLRREHVRHVADGRGAAPVVVADHRRGRADLCGAADRHSRRGRARRRRRPRPWR